MAQDVDEQGYYSPRKVTGGILTVHFTYGKNNIKVIGAMCRRKGKKIYETENNIYW